MTVKIKKKTKPTVKVNDNTTDETKKGKTSYDEVTVVISDVKTIKPEQF